MTTQQPGNQQGQQSAAMVVGPKARFELIKKELEAKAPLLHSMLPEHMRRNPDRMIRIIVSAVSRTPDLLDCTPTSIVLASSQGCACGLEPNTPLKLAYLVPFHNRRAQKKEAQFIPGYPGLIRLATQSQEVQKVVARPVYAKDHFKAYYGNEDRIDHQPLVTGDRGEFIAAYAMATLRSGEKQWELMDLAQLERIRARSQSPNEGPWATDTIEMYRKTTVRRLAKYLPLSEEKFVMAVQHQIAAERGEGPDFSDFIDATAELADPATGEVLPAGNGGAAAKPTRGEALQNKIDDKQQGSLSGVKA